MNDKTFFKHYIPAFKKALSEAKHAKDFSVIAPSWFYPEDIMKELMLFEDSHYEEYPVIERVAYYFHAIEHNFPSFEGIDIHDYRQSIIEEMEQLEKKYLSDD